MQSLLSYYTSNRFNPVPIDIDDHAKWTGHFAKRRNLYERHLRIPFGLLNGCDVLEFGCNSGENALVLAAAGARLTLVEPNEQATPRLERLFDRFGFSSQLQAVHNKTIGEFAPKQYFDLVIAEGFLNTLPDRDALLAKLAARSRPGGIIVLSFDDRYGGLIEQMKRLVHWRACSLSGVTDIFSDASLKVCEALYLEDFLALNASRPFHAWWMDQVVNPFALDLWTYDEILPVLEGAGCQLHATSPVWADADRFDWYKDVPEDMTWQSRFRNSWCAALPFILTGKPIVPGSLSVDRVDGVLRDLDDFLCAIAEYTREYPSKEPLPILPGSLSAFLADIPDASAQGLGEALKSILDPDFTGTGEDYISLYSSLSDLRALWGTAYHYLSCVKVS